MKIFNDDSSKRFHLQRGLVQLIFAAIIFYGLVGRFEGLTTLYLLLLLVNGLAFFVSTAVVQFFHSRNIVNSFLINLLLAGLFFMIGNFFSEELRFEVVENVVIESVDADGTAQAVGVRVFEYSGWEFMWIYFVHGFLAYAGYLKLRTSKDEVSNFSEEVFKVKLGNKVHFLPFQEIEYLEASGNYVHVFAAEKKYTSRIAIQEILDQANKNYLLRIHRSFAVNVNQIRELIPKGEGHAVVLRSGSEVKIGKNYKASLFDHLGVNKQ